ncbi:SigE family RNA polymerase sigma factor [Nocardioides ferulae]|uniref:SigE family RNA polymerase sigma factor n=1 Tax=Nocardioides ferulae TaxID=2340821 RepID=UPI000EAE1B2A|nr:SigE family RNA polymerase sigma factor [Nocardioides ferulae]
MPRPPKDEEFTDFVHASWPSLYRTAYLLLGDHAAAEDLVQTALAKTYAAWSKVRSVEAAPAFARTTLVNTANSWFRRRSWGRERPTDPIPERGAPAPDPSDRPAVVAALATLPPRQRAVVVLRYYEDLSVAQVARILGCAEGTVKSQTSDALAKLRVELGEAVVPETLGASHD